MDIFDVCLKCHYWEFDNTKDITVQKSDKIGFKLAFSINQTLPKQHLHQLMQKDLPLHVM